MNKKFLLCLVGFCINTAIWAQNCPPGDVTLTSQSQIDSFAVLYPDCHVINGNLTIDGGGGTGITHLTGLAGIREIANKLSIQGTGALGNLKGLDSLTHIGQELTLQGNTGLQTLDGLQGIQELSDLYLFNNSALQSLTGLDNLVTAKQLIVQNSPALQDLNGLRSLTATTGDILILSCGIANLQGLGHLQSTRKIKLVGNQQLTGVTGLDQLSSLPVLIFSGNNNLSSLAGLEMIQQVGHLEINSNPLLTNLNGLNGLQSVWYLILNNNNLLSDVDALQNLPSLDWAEIQDNPNLSYCSIPAVCTLLLEHPEHATISNNASGCNSIPEAEASCNGLPVVVTVRRDLNNNCEPDASDPVVEGVKVLLENADHQALRVTQANGEANFGYVDSTIFLLRLPKFPNANWEVCVDSVWLDPSTGGDTLRQSFVLSAAGECPELTIDLGMPPFFRGCLVESALLVQVANVGAVNAEGVAVQVLLPPLLQFAGSVPPPVAQNGDTLLYDLGDLPPLELSVIQLSVHTNCDSVLFGRSVCLNAWTTLSNPCNPPSSISEIRLFSECLGDTSVRFTLKNLGSNPTQGLHEYVIIEDEIIMLTEPFSLNPFESMYVEVPSDGSTLRMEATKYDDGTPTATVREGCGGFSPGYTTAYWLDRSARSYDFDCRDIRVAYDPNEKSAIPTGLGNEHIITANRDMLYTIAFQNTGTDTAFRVLLRDVLPEQLEVESFQPQGASHPCNWQIKDGRLLEVLFQPIALPDSNVNEVASHGYFSFSMRQKTDLPVGTSFKNTASIIFDFNPPIVTNTVTHVIGKLTVAVEEPTAAPLLWTVAGNPTNDAAVFKSLDPVGGENRFELADAQGRVCRMERFTGGEFLFRRGSLPAGCYAFRIVDARRRVFSGKIVIAP